jgi:hypothetical protein
MLLDRDHSTKVTVIEERAEIGFPCRMPGILRDSSRWLSTLEDWGVSSQGDGLSVGEGSVSFRRAWLEKDVSLSLVEKGGSILLRTRVEDGEGGSLVFQGAGGSTGWKGDLVIRVPENPLENSPRNRSWTGLLTSDEVAGGWPHLDGTWESWSEDVPKESGDEVDGNNSLELIETSFSSFDAATIDGSLSRAAELFDALADSL